MDLKLSYAHGAPAQDHKGPVEITKLRDAASGFACCVYQCSLEEDFDGAPDAYGWDNPTPDPVRNPATALQRNVTGRDGIGNATSPHQQYDAGLHDFAYVGLYATDQTTATARGISIDKRPRLEARRKMTWVKHVVNGKTDMAWESVALAPGAEGYFPVVQDGHQPAPGHYVSTTSIAADTGYQEWDQRRWVNANVIPYAAYAGWWAQMQVNQGDIGIAFARDTGDATAFVFADAGSGHVGEVSHKALQNLTKSGGTNENKFNFIVFPGSGAGVAGLLTNEDVIEARAIQLVSKLSSVDAAGELLLLSSFDMDRNALARWAKGARGSDDATIAVQGRYDLANRVLSDYGFTG